MVYVWLDKGLSLDLSYKSLFSSGYWHFGTKTCPIFEKLFTSIQLNTTLYIIYDYLDPFPLMVYLKKETQNSLKKGSIQSYCTRFVNLKLPLNIYYDRISNVGVTTERTYLAFDRTRIWNCILCTWWFYNDILKTTVH